MAGYTYPVRIPRPIPPGARRILKVGWAILAVEVVGVGIAAGALLPMDTALAAILLIDLPFLGAWGLILRHITRKRFGVPLPRFENE